MQGCNALQTAEDKDGDSNDGHAVNPMQDGISTGCFPTGIHRWQLATACVAQSSVLLNHKVVCCVGYLTNALSSQDKAFSQVFQLTDK